MTRIDTVPSPARRLRRAGRWVKPALIGLAALAALAAAAATTALALGHRKMQRTVELPPIAAPAWPAEARNVERGRYLYASRGCGDCHGADGGGRVFIDDAAAGLKVRGANLTALTTYGDTDWVRLLRHGVKPDGRAALIMPVEDYARMTEADLASIVAYVRSLPAAPGGPAELKLPVPMVAAYGVGAFRDASEKIDHHAAPAEPVAKAVSAEHGAYVAQMCVGCHGAKLEGGRIPGTPPDWPAAARLAPGEGNVMARYESPEAFITMLKSGKRPDGTPVRVMPFEALAQMDDTDARALHLFLQSQAQTQTQAQAPAQLQAKR